jgi:hypothetical protein
MEICMTLFIHFFLPLAMAENGSLAVVPAGVATKPFRSMTLQEKKAFVMMPRPVGRAQISPFEKLKELKSEREKHKEELANLVRDQESLQKKVTASHEQVADRTISHLESFHHMLIAGGPGRDGVHSASEKISLYNKQKEAQLKLASLEESKNEHYKNELAFEDAADKSIQDISQLNQKSEQRRKHILSLNAPLNALNFTSGIHPEIKKHLREETEHAVNINLQKVLLQHVNDTNVKKTDDLHNAHLNAMNKLMEPVNP